MLCVQIVAHFAAVSAPKVIEVQLNLPGMTGQRESLPINCAVVRLNNRLRDEWNKFCRKYRAILRTDEKLRGKLTEKCIFESIAEAIAIAVPLSNSLAEYQRHNNRKQRG